MNVLVACEFSGVVRDAFRRRGHEAWSCDLLGPDDMPEEFAAQEFPNYHLEGDVRWFLNDALSNPGARPWDLMIAFPPCTYLCSSGLHWNKRRPERARLTEDALKFVKALLDAPIPRIALENPVGCISTRIRKPDQIIHPWQFGEDASKTTCLWLKGLPKLKPAAVLPGGRSTRRANQTASGQNKLGPSLDRWKLRSITYRGIAEAMAVQWGVEQLNKKEE